MAADMVVLISFTSPGASHAAEPAAKRTLCDRRTWSMVPAPSGEEVTCPVCAGTLATREAGNP